MVQILDGKKTAEKINQQTAQRVQAFHKPITLVTVYDAADPGSKMYVSMKHKKAAELGINTKEIIVSDQDTTESLLEVIADLNQDQQVSSILVQSPLPKNIDQKQIFAALDPKKDADGLSIINQGALFENSGFFVPPATPAGVMRLLDQYDIDVEQKMVAVVGRSVLFGRPMSALLVNANASVTLLHRFTTADQLDIALKNADIVVVAVGIANFIKGHQIKEGAVVIDVGANKLDGKTVGDVDFLSVSPKASWITPVPGGVGPMTIATLLSQVVELAYHN